MKQAQVVTEWRVDSEGTREMRLAVDHHAPNEIAINDVTGQPSANLPTDPNLLVVQVFCTDAVLAGIEADANCKVLWSEEISTGLASASKVKKDEKPPAKEKTDLETFLKAKGVKDADAATLCKKTAANATRAQIADAVIAWCNKLPKKK